MHVFLWPHDYHSQPAPVNGKDIEVKNIQDQMYLLSYQETRWCKASG